MKRSTMMNIDLFLSTMACLGSAFSAISLLALLFMIEPTAIKILCVCMAVLPAIDSVLIGTEVKSKICMRLTNRRDGVLEDPIPSDHGNTISEVIYGIRNEAVEHVAYFTLDGAKIGESTLNSPSETALILEKHKIVKRLAGCISVHNHPGDRIIAFSPNDIRIAVARRELRAIVVTKDMCFVMSIPDGRRFNSYAVYRVAKAAYKGEDYEEASLESCAAVAKRFGFSFYAVPFPDSIYNLITINAKIAH